MMVKARILVLATILLIMAVAASAISEKNSTEKEDIIRAKIVLFWGDGCPHCAAEEKFLAPILKKNPGLELAAYEVWYNDSNAKLLKELSIRYGMEPRGVPTTMIGDKIWVGFDENKEGEMKQKIASCLAGGCEDPMKRLEKPVEEQSVKSEPATDGTAMANPDPATGETKSSASWKGVLRNPILWLVFGMLIFLTVQLVWTARKGKREIEIIA